MREPDARTFEVEAHHELERQAGKKRDVMIGGVICAIGVVVVTFASYSSASASSGSGRYVVAYGAIAFGAFRLISGLAR